MLFYKYVYWCCPHSMWSRVCAGCSSIRPSVCLTHRSKAATAAGGFAAERPACSRPVGRRYRLIAASALRAPCCRRRRSAANAGSVVVLRADEAGSTESIYFDGVPGCPSLRTWTNCIVDCWHLNVMFLNSMRWLTAPISQRWWRLLAVISTRSRPTRFITPLSSDHHNGDNRSHRCCVTLLLRSSCDWRVQRHWTSQHFQGCIMHSTCPLKFPTTQFVTSLQSANTCWQVRGCNYYWKIPIKYSNELTFHLQNH